MLDLLWKFSLPQVSSIFFPQGCSYYTNFLTISTCRVVVVSPSDPVYVATKKMREFQVNSVIIATGSKIHGILTYNFHLGLFTIFNAYLNDFYF